MDAAVKAGSLGDEDTMNAAQCGLFYSTSLPGWTGATRSFAACAMRDTLWRL
jgi:hypothetical protein